VLSLIVGAFLLAAGASLAVVTQLNHLSWFITLMILVLLAPAGLACLFSADDKAKATMGKWWNSLHGWFLGYGGWSLWEAVALGILFFGIFAGAAFLGQPLVILAGVLAPWLAGLWAARRGTQLPALLSTLAGAVVGFAEGLFFLAWLPMELQDYPAKLLFFVLTCLAGAGLGFWACARGQIKLERHAASQKQ